MHKRVRVRSFAMFAALIMVYGTIGVITMTARLPRIRPLTAGGRLMRRQRREPPHSISGRNGT